MFTAYVLFSGFEIEDISRLLPLILRFDRGTGTCITHPSAMISVLISGLRGKTCMHSYDHHRDQGIGSIVDPNPRECCIRWSAGRTAAGDTCAGRFPAGSPQFTLSTHLRLLTICKYTSQSLSTRRISYRYICAEPSVPFQFIRFAATDEP